MFDQKKNFAVSSVATAPAPAISGTSLIVADRTVFPSDGPFNLVVWPVNSNPTSADAEIVRVPAGGVSGSTFTIQRAQEGSTARAIQAGDNIQLAITALALTDLEGMTMLNFMLA